MHVFISSPQINPTIVERKEARYKDTLLDLTAEEPKETRLEDRLLVLVFSSTSPDAHKGPVGHMAGPKKKKQALKGTGEERHDFGTGGGGVNGGDCEYFDTTALTCEEGAHGAREGQGNVSLGFLRHEKTSPSRLNTPAGECRRRT